MGMKLYINGTQLTDFLLSTPYKDTIDEELDQLNFQVKSDTKLTYKKFDKLRYVIEHGTINPATKLDKIMCLWEIVETWEGEKWLYQLSCLSPTKILESVIINGMAETYPSADLYDQMTRVKEKINAQLTLEGVGLTILFDETTIKDSGNVSVIKDITGSSDFLWDGQVNVREIFNDMLDKADAICVATDFNISSDKITSITLSAVKRNKRGNRILFNYNDVDNGGLTDVSKVVKGISYNRNSEFAVGNIISLTKNAIAKDNVQQAYLPARNTDLTIDDEASWHIITQEPIYSLNKVIALMPLNNILMDYWEYELINGTYTWVKKTYTISNDNPTLRILAPVDITDYIVEKSVFDNMSLADQSKHLYFKRGEKGIYNLYSLYKWNALISKIALRNIMGDTIGDIPSLSPNENDVVDWREYDFDRVFFQWNDNGQDWDNIKNQSFSPSSSYHLTSDGTRHDGDIAEFRTQATPLVETAKAYKQAMFSVNYQPYCDSVVKIEKSSMTDLEANAKNLSVIKNQSDRTIDAEKYYNSQQALINRMGNKEMFIDAMVDLNASYAYKTSLWDLGDYVELGANLDKWTITQRTFENYNGSVLKVKYTFSKKYNASNVDIQLKRDKRLYGIPLSNYVDRYIIVRYPSADNIDKIAIKCWDDFTGSTTTQGYCIAEMVKIGNDTLTDRVARCLDNYAIDIERTKYSSTVVNVYLRYCNTTGFIDTIEAYGMTNAYYNSLSCSDYSRLPFKPNSEMGNLSHDAYNLSLTNIKKDKMERIIIIVKKA